MKLNNIKTINVIERVDNAIKALYAFPDDGVGNANAEHLFETLARENDFSDEEIEVGLEDGVCGEGTYELYLILSE